MGQRQGIAILRQLFYAIVVVLLIYLPHVSIEKNTLTVLQHTWKYTWKYTS